MKDIELGKGRTDSKHVGFFAIVSDEDYEHLIKFKWHIYGGNKSGNVYVKRSIRSKDGKYKHITMHKEITGFDYVDHINGNGLDNRRENLRSCTKAENQRNRKLNSNSTTGYKGVSMHSSGKYYVARISINGKRIALGTSLDKKHLAKLYNDAAIKYFGEFARLNPID